MQRNFWTWQLATACLLLTAVGPTVAAPPAAERLLPDSTVAFLSVADFADFKSKWQRTQFHRLTSAAEVARFGDELKRWLQAMQQDLMRINGTWLGELTAVAEGEVSVALLVLPSSQPAVVMLADVTGRVEQANQLIERVETRFREQSVDAQRLQHARGRLVVFNLPTRRTYPRQAVLFLSSENTLGVATSLEAAEHILENGSSSQSKRLADLESYQSVMSRCQQEAGQREPDARWFVDVLGLTRFRHQITEDETYRKVAAFLKRHGFDALRGVGGFMHYATGKHDLLFYTHVYAPPPYRRSMNMITFDVEALQNDTQWATQHAATLVTAGADMVQIFDNFAAIFDDLVADGIEGTFDDVVRDIAEVTGVDLRDDVFKLLRSQVTSIGEDGHFVVAIQVVDGQEARIAKSFEGLLKEDPEARPLRVEGYPHEMWKIGEQALMVAREHVLLTSDYRLLQKLLRQGYTPLAQDTEYQRVQAALQEFVKSDVSVRAFGRLDSRMPGYAQLRQQNDLQDTHWIVSSAIDILAEALGLPPERISAINFRTLPAPEVLQRSTGAGGACVRRLDDGWIISGFVLPPS